MNTIPLCAACKKPLKLDVGILHLHKRVYVHKECVDAPLPIRIDNERELYKAVERILQKLEIYD